MRCSERSVKWLDAELRGVALESLRIHQGDGAKSANVAVVERAIVIKNELDRRVLAFVFRQIARVDQKCASEAGLYDQAIARRKVEDNELRAPPGVCEPRADDALG